MDCVVDVMPIQSFTDTRMVAIDRICLRDRLSYDGHNQLIVADGSSGAPLS